MTPITTPALPEKEVRLWSMLCHLAALTGLLIPSFGAVVGPLVFWLVKRNDHPTIDANGKEALNFQLSALIYSWGLGLLGAATLFILVGFLFLFCAFVVSLAALILAIVASIKVSNGETFQYPFTIRFFT
ncbi:MAG: DUF4870 domain-containing protein [Verrucomicrobiae bacterium]|nr:DUF4870 domain-containing protein [Verrucomicrobiae bacterium]